MVGIVKGGCGGSGNKRVTKRHTHTHTHIHRFKTNRGGVVAVEKYMKYLRVVGVFSFLARLGRALGGKKRDFERQPKTGEQDVHIWEI